MLSFGTAECGDSIAYNADTDRVIYSKTGNKDDYYTRLGVAWDYHSESAKSLKPWLDPAGTGVSSIDGLNPGSVQEERVRKGKCFSLWPNPVSSMLWFSSLSPGGGAVTYRVYDLRGALLVEGTGELPGPLGVEVDGLQSGFYLMLLESATGRDVFKFVVSR